MQKHNLGFGYFLKEVNDDLQQTRAKKAACLVVVLITLTMVGVNYVIFFQGFKANVDAIRIFVLIMDVSIVASVILSLIVTWRIWQRNQIDRVE